ncbi:MAG: putative glycosyltransferase EpsH [bacterium ADurb.BinA186]|nr:MAG: putative glycosyltransferase EpsH [bacterium ADurb.BinA186]
MPISRSGITIVIPAYNASSFAHSFFECLRKQTYHDFVCVFVTDQKDNGTTIQAIKAEMKQADFFDTFLLFNPDSVGVGASRDYALDHWDFQTEFVSFMDIDDCFAEDFYQKLHQRAVSDQADITYCGYQRIDSKDRHIIATEMVHNPDFIMNPVSDWRTVFLNPSPWNKLFRFSIIQDARFIFPGGGEDGMFLLKVLPRCQKISFVNEPLYSYFVNPSSLTSMTNDKLLESGKGAALSLSDYQKQVYSSCLPAYRTLIDTFVFVRIGIGQTTRVCLGNKKDRKQTLRNSRAFLDANFPLWRKSSLLSFSSGLKHGPKVMMLWWCRSLYKHGHFGLFIFLYSTYTKLFKKDIKW